MKFSWKALLLAPTVIPFLYSMALVIAGGGEHRLAGFVLFFVMGCFVSYGVTVFLFLPTLFLVSRFTALTFPLTSLVGTLLAVITWFPIDWEMYASSGVDSGPPEGSFAQFLLRDLADPTTPAFPLAGLVTAAVYWYLSNRTFGVRNGPENGAAPK